MNINIEKINKLIKEGKKLVLTRLLPTILSATAIASAMSIPVKAIDKDDSNTIKSVEVYNSDNSKVANGKEMLDEAFDRTYSLLANGGLNVNDSVYRFLAEMARINNYLDLNIKNYNYNDKASLQNYYKEKLTEAKIVFSNITNISINTIENVDKKYDCEYIDSLSTNDIKYVAVNEMRNNNIISTDYYKYDDSRLSNDKSLIILPSISSLSNSGDISLTYTSSIVSRNDKNYFESIKGVIDSTYEKIENATNKGNYDVSYGMTKENVITSINGDTNLIKSGIQQKYVNYTSIQSYINSYLSFKQQKAIIGVYKRNKNSISYNEYKNYIINNNFNYYSVPDKGIIKTCDLSNGYQFDNQISNNVTENQIIVKYGVNTRIDGVLFKPTNVNGQKTESFIYEGTTWVAVRPLVNAYGCTIYPSSNGDIVINEQGQGFYTYDSNGTQVYCVSNSAINVDNKINRNLVTRVLNVSRYANIVFNGQKITLYDSKGNPVKAMIIDGTTYIPAKSFTNLFSCDIGYDNVEHTALLTRYTYSKNYTNSQPIPGTTNNNVPETNVEIPDGSQIVSQTVIGEQVQPGYWYPEPGTGKIIYVDENGNSHYVDAIGDRPKIR